MNKTLIGFFGLLLVYGCASTERTPEEVAAAAKVRNQCSKEALWDRSDGCRGVEAKLKLKLSEKRPRKQCEAEQPLLEVDLLKASKCLVSIGMLIILSKP